MYIVAQQSAAHNLCMRDWDASNQHGGVTRQCHRQIGEQHTPAGGDCWTLDSGHWALDSGLLQNPKVLRGEHSYSFPFRFSSLFDSVSSLFFLSLQLPLLANFFCSFTLRSISYLVKLHLSILSDRANLFEKYFKQSSCL